jgi:hypothetical protein
MGRGGTGRQKLNLGQQRERVVIKFELGPHGDGHKNVVEVWANGKFVAAIYANGSDGIRLLSQHVKTINQELVGNMTNFEVEFNQRSN